MPENPDLVLKVSDAQAGRLDLYLTRHLKGYSRARVQGLIRDGWVNIVGGRPARPAELLKRGVRVEVRFPPRSPEVKVTVDPSLESRILFEDAVLLVLDKPAGLVVHPGAGHRDDSIVQKLSFKFKDGDWPEPNRPGVVHRLDRDTSGVLLLAKTPEALADLSEQFAYRKVEKVYHAIAEGTFTAQSGSLESFLSRHPSSRTRFTVSGQGRWASTQFRVLESLMGAAYVEVRPLTGRSHQIRVHLAHMGHPVMGDTVYGALERPLARRQMLHAKSLMVTHPKTGRRIKWEAPIPADFQEVLKELRGKK
jgi:23S rRNA pseudouridine1911/1915/1917 synthase